MIYRMRAILQRRMKIRMNATYIRLFYVCRLKFDNDGSRVSCQHHVLMITKAIWQPLSLLLIISQKRSKLLSMAVKILPPLIMQYLLNISNNSAQTNTVCVCTAVTDSRFYHHCHALFFLYLLPLHDHLKKESRRL